MRRVGSGPVPRAHGIGHSEDGSGWLSAGMLAFLGWVEFKYGPGGDAAERGVPPWNGPRFGTGFMSAVEQYRDLFWKFDRAAELASRCLRLLEEGLPGHGAHVRTLAPWINAHQDVQIYVDAMLVYLRVQLDCLAVAIASMYPHGAGAPSRGFRDQVKWFNTTPGSELDPAYAAIVQEPLPWFDQLAARAVNEGLRNIRLHGLGRYQLTFRPLPGETGTGQKRLTDIRAELVGGGGAGAPNVLASLRSIVDGYFCFLDEALAHFVARAQEEIGAPVVPEDWRVLNFGPGQAPESVWVYPSLAD